MTVSLERRLESWRAVLRDGGPAWIVEHAPKAIAEIEAMIAAQGIEAATAAETVEQGSVHEIPVRVANAPKSKGHSNDHSRH